ncbi:LysR substrate-binding domain-containing protein [Pedobacter sp. UBA5917]|jgi:LysR family cyn operon transcriptional activator|uniref:LysR substrate-binding domain-containing protein n=1 Tax=Pedobacter sp. UBA5917 TaxID=1947061 RepID=UPI0025D50A91|nr:LysR substrate-binding domain-containing protein [Pedobacter sp. UBA5917]
MELRQLRYFIKAKELQNFTEAAAQLFISQSTLSQQIKQLEDELGTPLFNRIGKHIYTTEAGNLFYSYALQCLNKANDGYQLLKDLSKLQTGTLVIGTSYGLRHILTPALVKFHQKYPKVVIQVLFGTSSEMIDRLCRFELDIVMTFDEVESRKELKYRPLFESTLGFIVTKDSPLAKKKSISLQEIKQLKLALPAKGFSTRNFVDEIFVQHQITPQVSLEINDIPTLLELVGTGHWNTILTNTSVSNQSHLVSVPISKVKNPQHAVLISLTDVYEKQAVKAFLKILSD